jgi:peptide/nickel transport system ATP-binding protein/oligopeptide transport system ATP-binding protein
MLLNVENLSVSFKTDEGIVRAVDDVSFFVREGEVLGIVGESGCGKTVTAMSLLRLIPSPPGSIDGGRILFRGEDLRTTDLARLRKVRGKKIGMIFQEPMTALSPLVRIGDQLVETIQFHERMSNGEARRTGVEWLGKVGIPDPSGCMDRFPHELSGGMRQRVMIAAALMLDPELIVADEPTTALDVTVQAQIFDLIRNMKSRSTAMILITHDMGVIWEMCDRVLVMYASRVAEEGTVRDVFAAPQHPYTEGLLAAIPRLHKRGEKLKFIPGHVPSPLNYPPGCHFADRCPHVFAPCRGAQPPLYGTKAGGKSACFLLAPRPSTPDPHVH